LEQPTTMKDKKQLIDKVKHLLRRAQAPQFLHHYGPKTYRLWQHVFALFVRSYCRLSHRRTTQFLRDLGFSVASKSTLQRYAAKLRLPFWQTLLRASAGRVNRIGAIDGTGLERTNPSWHYVKRIFKGTIHRRGFFLMLLVSTNNKVLSLRLRSKRAGEIKDVRYLWKNAHTPFSVMVMDKAYDAEWLHKFFAEQGVRSIVPVRKRAIHGYYRKKLRDCFPQRLYNKRSIAESVIHALKQKFGSCVNAQLIGPARTDVYCRAILHNLFCWIVGVLGHNHIKQNFYKWPNILRAYARSIRTEIFASCSPRRQS